jgi:hypothetical protein
MPYGNVGAMSSVCYRPVVPVRRSGFGSKST